MAQNQNFIADGLRFSINPDGKSITLSGLINKNTQKVAIPSTVNNYPVTAIGLGAFRGCTGLTSVTIPDSVTSIGDWAFPNCTSLTSVTIPNSVTSIDNWAFDGCTGLTSIKVDSGNSRYNSRDNCNAIIETATNSLICGCKSTIIPDSVTSIGDWAFNGCTGLTSVTIPNSVTSIGVYAFYDCSGLTSVTIPESVTSIGYGAFRGCTGLTSVTIPDSVTTIGDWAFPWCAGLTSVTIPNSVTSIGTGAFRNCPGLKQIILTGFGHNSKVMPEEIQKQIEILRIGSGISEIGDIRCNPKEIWCYAEVPPKCSESVFTGFDAVLHVPQRTAAAYFTADVWRNFSNIVFDANEKLTLSAPDARPVTVTVVVTDTDVMSRK